MLTYLEKILSITHDKSLDIYSMYHYLYKLTTNHILNTNYIECLKLIDGIDIYRNGKMYTLNMKWIILYASNALNGSDILDETYEYSNISVEYECVAEEFAKIGNFSCQQHQALSHNTNNTYLCFKKDNDIIGWALASVVKIIDCKYLYIWDVVRVPELPYVNITSYAWLHFAQVAELQSIYRTCICVPNDNIYAHNILTQYGISTINQIDRGYFMSNVLLTSDEIAILNQQLDHQLNENLTTNSIQVKSWYRLFDRFDIFNCFCLSQ